MGTILIFLFGILLALNLPIAFVLAGASLVAMLLKGHSLLMVPQMFVGGIQSYILMAVPLFMLAGALMNEAGTTDRIFRFARAIVGHLAGGLAHVNVIGSLIFSGMSGSAVADSSGLGTIEIKAMKDQGYDPGFSAAITAASSTIGPIFPPSIPMVVFGGLANVSIGKLFLGGIIPGLMMALYLMVAIVLISRRRNYPRDKRATRGEFVASFKESFLALLMPVLVLGGILGGIFTPTEAAAVASIYALILGIFVYRTLSLKALPRIFATVAVNTAVVMLIIAATSPFKWIIAFEKVPEAIYLALSQVTSSPIILLLILNLAFLGLGCIMENTAIIILSVPILLPIIKHFDLDPVHFGVVMILNLMIGLITPPIGLCLFTTCTIAQISMETLLKEIKIFFLALIAVLLTITYFPEFVVWLPNWILGKF
jgi:tripartite ATP-independent transporter DctM subunit